MLGALITITLVATFIIAILSRLPQSEINDFPYAIATSMLHIVIAFFIYFAVLGFWKWIVKDRRITPEEQAEYNRQCIEVSNMHEDND